MLVVLVEHFIIIVERSVEFLLKEHISLNHTFKLNAAIHFLDVSEMPAAVDVPLLGEHLTFGPVFKERLSVKIFFTWIDHFKTFLSSFFLGNGTALRNWTGKGYDHCRRLVHQRVFVILYEVFLLLNWAFDNACISEWSRTGACSLWHNFFNSGVPFAILNFFATLFIDLALRAKTTAAISDDITVTVYWFYGILIALGYERLYIRNRKCASTVSTKRSVWFVNSLLKPANELTPNILAIILFAATILFFALTFFVHVRTFRMFYIAVSYENCATPTLLICLRLCKITFRAGIHF